MTPKELQEIEERCNRATPGPWLVFSDDLIMRAIGRKGVFSLKNGLLPTYMLFDPVKATREDECFVAFAQKDIPDLLAHIKELESRLPRWIPVEKRLPKGRAVVTIYSKDMGVLLEASCIDECWYWNMGIVKNVTHWMPLPTKPEDEE